MHPLVLVLVFVYDYIRGPYSEGEPAGGNKTGGAVDSRDTSLISPAALPFNALNSRWTHMHVCTHTQARKHTHMPTRTVQTACMLPISCYCT